MHQHQQRSPRVERGVASSRGILHEPSQSFCSQDQKGGLNTGARIRNSLQNGDDQLLFFSRFTCYARDLCSVLSTEAADPERSRERRTRPFAAAPRLRKLKTTKRRQGSIACTNLLFSIRPLPTFPCAFTCGSRKDHSYFIKYATEGNIFTTWAEEEVKVEIYRRQRYISYEIPACLNGTQQVRERVGVKQGSTRFCSVHMP